MPFHRVPHPFTHCDGEVAEFPVVAGEGFQLVYEAGHKMLGDGTLLVGKDVFENGRAFLFRETVKQKQTTSPLSSWAS